MTTDTPDIIDIDDPDLLRSIRLEQLALAIISMTEDIDEPIKPDEFINDTRVRHTLHSMAMHALGPDRATKLGILSEPIPVPQEES